MTYLRGVSPSCHPFGWWFLTMLSKNDIKLTGFLLEHPMKKFSIREISRQVKIDYKLTHSSIGRLFEKGIIDKEKYGKTELCKIGLKDAVEYLVQVENIKARNFLERNIGIKLIIEEIKDKIKIPYYSLILFGSYTKGQAHKRSDLDMLLIVPGKEFIKKAEIAIHSVISIKPVKVHSLVMIPEDFKEMLASKEELNVAKEALKNHLIFHGAEAYYKLLEVL